MPETLTQAQLLAATLETMDDDLQISRKQARDFIESASAVVEEALADGQKVALFGLVTLTPSYKAAKPRRKGIDPRTQEERTYDAQPAKVRLRSTPGKRLKDALPSPTSGAGKSLKAELEARQEAARKRAAAREREEKKQAKAGGGKKSSGKKKGR